MRFIDEATIQAIAGDGGSGAVSWRREKYVPRGGPDGGDGGDGGAVVLVSDPGINTLMDCALNPLLKAGSGGSGESNQKTGKTGKDVLRRVPVGTQVFFGEELVADLNKPHMRWIAARGGKGGKGNAFFKSASNQAPQRAQPGRQGERHELRLVLKSVADIGLVGLPNVGKSSLVAALSEAHPLVADYPFTTLTPSLGVVSLDAERRFVLADIPGLIAGAHQGKGLGIRFLKHIERTSALAYVLDVTQDPEINQAALAGELLDDKRLCEVAIQQFTLLEEELRSFNESLAERPRLILFSKADIPVQEQAHHAAAAYFDERGMSILLVSSHSGSGLAECKEALMQLAE